LLGFTARKHAQWRDNFAIDDEESICICGTSDYCFNLLKISNLIGWNPSWPGAQGISQQMKFRGFRQSFSCQFLRVRAVIDFINVCKIADDIVAACHPAIKTILARSCEAGAAGWGNAMVQSSRASAYYVDGNSVTAIPHNGWDVSNMVFH